MRLEVPIEEYRERFRLIGEIWLICCELADGDCRADLEDFELESYDITDYIDEEADVEIDMGTNIKCWFGGIDFQDGTMPNINFTEEWEEGRNVSCALPAIYTPSKTLKIILDLLTKYKEEYDK